MEKNKKIIKVELEYFNDAKYFEGINSKKDPGEFFIMEMIKTNGAELRKRWNESKCQNCLKWEKCGHKLKVECDQFQFDEKENENHTGGEDEKNTD